MYDFIGDIHGHADKLEVLLLKMGYTNDSGVYRHPERKVFFIGDYIDRGPEIKKTVSMVRKMTEAGAALAVMGNHEFNAIQFHAKNKDGAYLRKHCDKNIKQHSVTLKSYSCTPDAPSEELLNDIEWFKTLPLFYEEDGFRVVHAAWHIEHINQLKRSYPDGIVDDEFYHKASVKNTPEYTMAECILKGIEIKLPDGLFFSDKDGNQRSEIRAKWWGRDKISKYKDIHFPPVEHLGNPVELPDSNVEAAILDKIPFYPDDHKPVFVGHYWKRGNPELESANVCCLDYSVAKNGNLVSYRWNGEMDLKAANFVSV